MHERRRRRQIGRQNGNGECRGLTFVMRPIVSFVILPPTRYQPLRRRRSKARLGKADDIHSHGPVALPANIVA